MRLSQCSDENSLLKAMINSNTTASNYSLSTCRMRGCTGRRYTSRRPGGSRGRSKYLYDIECRSNLDHLGAVVECVEASVAGVRRHPLAQPAALLALGAVLVAVGGRQIAAVASTITVIYRILAL